jgi:predicted MPP superfamily phosphohydrolase
VSTEAPSTELVVAQTPDEAALALRGQMVVAITDPVAIQRDIIESILDADNADDILGTVNNTIAGGDMLDVPFELHAVRILKSGLKGGLGVFAVLDAVTNDGRETKITTGAGNVMAQAVALWKRDLLPYKVKIVEAETPTAAGYKPQRLEAA